MKWRKQHISNRCSTSDRSSRKQQIYLKAFYSNGVAASATINMKQGIITDVKITSAYVNDGKAFIDESLCPESGMVSLDKGCDGDPVEENIKQNGCANGGIKKDNRKDKNCDLDRWRTQVRMPFENTFSKMKKSCRYWTKPKVKIQATFETIVHNLKRAIKIETLKLILV